MKMHHAILICLLAWLPAGCVTYLHDSKIKDLKPAQAELKTFAGEFQDRALYFTPPNLIGFEGPETLGSALRGMDYKSIVQIEITSEDNIVVKAPNDWFAMPPLHYTNGKDFY